MAVTQPVSSWLSASCSPNDSNVFVTGSYDERVRLWDRRNLGKPADEAEARKFLELLSGRRHRVHGGIALIGSDGRRLDRLITTQVTFKRLGLSAKKLPQNKSFGLVQGAALDRSATLAEKPNAAKTFQITMSSRNP